MFRHAMEDEERDVVIIRPNRDNAASKATRAVVILLLVVSVVLLLIVTFGGWSRLSGAKFLNIAYILIYVVMAYFVFRWSRGVLPMAAALAIILAILAGIAGPAWFDRDKTGFSDPALDSSVLGLFTLLVVPVQILLIAFAMRGFQQAWNVEEEVPADRYERDGGAGPGEPAPAAA
jgi:hypothetical protein